MKRVVYLIGVLSLLTSCGEEKGGKKRRIYFPEETQELERELEQNVHHDIRVASFKAKKLEVKLQKEGLLDSRDLEKGRTRYLREKILNQTFDNLYNQKEKESLKIDPADELRFFPNEVSFETKVIANEAINGSQSKSGSWSFDIKMSWRGLSKEDSLTDVLISLGSIDKKMNLLSQYGSDLIKRENGLAYSFNNQSGSKSFKLSFEQVPLSLMSHLVLPNTKVFFEIKDYRINNMGMKEFLSKKKRDQTRLIISLPYGEKYYWMKKGESLEAFLKDLDPSLELNYDHSLLSFLGHAQDEVFSYPDRVLINDETIDENLSFWWANRDEDLSKIKANGKTIVLSYFSLKELKRSQMIWSPLNFKFDDSFELSEKSSRAVVGKVKKYSVAYGYKDTVKEIPYEIGSEVCLEDNRFERKGVDCHIVWNPAFSYPVAHFRHQVVEAKKEREILEKELKLRKNDQVKKMTTGWIKVSSVSNEIVEIKKEALDEIGGGFVGWKAYDSRLNGYKVRAPFDSLASHQILNGHENEYEFNGWKLEFPAKN